MKRRLSVLLIVLLCLACVSGALAGSIITPNGGRAILWSHYYESEHYKAYIPSGNDATKLLPEAHSNRYKVEAYGYNSKKVYGYYTGWINTAYWFDN